MVREPVVPKITAEGGHIPQEAIKLSKRTDVINR